MSEPSINRFYLKPEVLGAIQKEFKKQRMVALREFASVKTRRDWKESYIPDRHRYEICPPLAIQKDIEKFTKLVTGQPPVHEGTRRFSKGSYTILHDKEMQKPGILALLFLDDWEEGWGARIVLMKEGKTVASFIPQKDTLLILERRKGERYFVKYVNQRAGKNKLRIVSG
jgi:hypothetical protein